MAICTLTDGHSISVAVTTVIIFILARCMVHGLDPQFTFLQEELKLQPV